MNVELRSEPIHSAFGGSVSSRVLRCPSSVDLIQKVPAYLRKPSAYADRGTALHAAITLLLVLAEDRHALVESLTGKTFGSYTITSDDVETALRPTYAYVETLLDTPGAEYFLERRVVFPAVPDTFGTVDLLVRIGYTLHVVDYKFGVGVRVLALTPDGAEDVINAQLLFYDAAMPRRRATRLCRGGAPLVARILRRGRAHRSDDLAARVDRDRRRDDLVGRGDARRA